MCLRTICQIFSTLRNIYVNYHCCMLSKNFGYENKKNHDTKTAV